MTSPWSPLWSEASYLGRAELAPADSLIRDVIIAWVTSSVRSVRPSARQKYSTGQNVCKGQYYFTQVAVHFTSHKCEKCPTWENLSVGNHAVILSNLSDFMLRGYCQRQWKRMFYATSISHDNILLLFSIRQTRSLVKSYSKCDANSLLKSHESFFHGPFPLRKHNYFEVQILSKQEWIWQLSHLFSILLFGAA